MNNLYCISKIKKLYYLKIFFGEISFMIFLAYSFNNNKWDPPKRMKRITHIKYL